jgi:hypothetical protein
MTQIPNQITFRCMSHHPELDADIEARISALGRVYNRIVRCRVLVEVPHRHLRDGTHVHVRIEIRVPGSSAIVVDNEPSLHSGRKDRQEEVRRKDGDVEDTHRHARVAIREAFDAARRRLQDFAREQRGDVKTHRLPSRLSRAPRVH